MHEPQNLNDIIFGNPESKLRIYDIVTGAQALPQESFFTVPGVLAKPQWPRCYLTQLRKAEPKKN